MKNYKKTQKSLVAYASTLEPSALKAQCGNIANYTLNEGETIADRLYRDHSSSDGHLRAAQLMKDAGCATEAGAKNNCFGTFTFEDGSSF